MSQARIWNVDIAFTMKRAAVAVLSAVVLLAASAGCGDDDGDGEGTVDVILSEFIVEPDTDSASAGETTFVADNEGGEIHELVVVEADSAEALPVDEDGAFDEEAFGEENIFGEVEDIASGDEAELTVDLEAGTYVLLCNIVEEEDGEVESHFAEGMHTTFTVE